MIPFDLLWIQTAEQEKALREQGGEVGASELGADSPAEVEELRELPAPNGRYMLLLLLLFFFFFFFHFFFFLGGLLMNNIYILDIISCWGTPSLFCVCMFTLMVCVGLLANGGSHVRLVCPFGSGNVEE